MITSILLTLAVSAAVGLVAARWNLPGGALIWSLGASAALHIGMPSLAALPSAFRVGAQILIGVAIGATITRRPLRATYAVRWSLLFCTALLVAGSVAAGLLLARLTPLDPVTALFALAPAGANDMAAVSLYFGVDAALVAACQVVRQLLVFVVVPVVFARMSAGGALRRGMGGAPDSSGDGLVRDRLQAYGVPPVGIRYRNSERRGSRVVGRGRDIVVAVVFAMVALFAVVAGRNLPLVSQGAPGPGLFPQLVAAAILVFAVALGVQVLLRRRSERTRVTTLPDGPDPRAADDGTGDAEERSVRRPLLLWAIVLAVSIGLPVLGFLPAMLLLTLLLLLGLERRFDVAALASAVAVPVASYALFALLLDVRLPTGLFG